MGRFDHSAIARHVGHRRQDVHRLRARDARHCIHCKRSDTRGGQALDQLRGAGRRQQCDNGGAAAQSVDLGVGGCINFDHNIAGPDLVGRSDRDPDVGVRGVRLVSGSASAPLHHYFIAEGDELSRRFGRGGDERRTGSRLARYADAHCCLLEGRWTGGLRLRYRSRCVGLFRLAAPRELFGTCTRPFMRSSLATLARRRAAYDFFDS